MQDPMQDLMQQLRAAHDSGDTAKAQNISLKVKLRRAHDSGNVDEARSIAQKLRGQPPVDSKGFMEKAVSQVVGGFAETGKRISDAFTGNAEFEDSGNIQDYINTMPAGGLFSGDAYKLAASDMFGNDQDVINKFKKLRPDKEVLQDQSGNPYFEDGGKKFYFNTPGADLSDVVNFAGDAGTYAAGGKLAYGIGKGALSRAGLMGVSQGSANALNQGLSGREEIDGGEAALAGIGGGAFDLAGSAINKVRNMKNGRNSLDERSKKDMDFADDNDLPIYYDDLSTSGTAAKIGQQLDEIPVVGGVKSRQKQNIASKQVAEKFTEKFTVTDELDDLYEIASKGANSHKNRSKKIADKMFKKANDELDPGGAINVEGVKESAQNLIKSEMKKGSAANKKTVGELSKYLNIPESNFSNWAQVRSGLVTKIRDMERSTNPDTNTLGALKQLSIVMNKSMGEVAQKISPKGERLWRKANNFYDGAVVRYRKRALRAAMKEDDPETMLNLFISKAATRDSTDKAKKLFNSMDKKRKAAVRQGMMQKAYADSLSDKGGFSPARWASTMEKYENRLNVVLSKEDRAFAKGLTRYMRITQKSGDYMADVKTGQKAVGTIYTLAAGANAVANPLSTATAVTGVAGLKKLFRTKRGRSYMLALSTIPKGRKPSKQLMTDIARYLTVKEVSE